MSMKNITYILLLVCLPVLSIVAVGQQPAGKTDSGKPAAKTAPAVKHYLPYVYLGTSNYRGGAIKKSEFDQLLKQGLTARDTFGNNYKVIGFEFSYGEKSLYEDSVGNNIVLTDYLTEFCHGDTVTPAISSTIYDRTKPGDSVYFDGIKVLKYIGNTKETVPYADATLGMGMKFWITR